MFEILNQRLMQHLAAPPDLAGGAVFASRVLAEWAIFIGPALLVLFWIFGGTLARRAAVGAGLSAILGLAIAGAISTLFFHPRPFMDSATRNYLFHAVDSSFPSDHATLLFALGFSLAIVPALAIRRAGAGLLLLGCAVGWARVYLGAHYPLDIVGAAVVGLVSAALAAGRPGLRLRDALTGLGEKIDALPLGGTRLRRR